MPEDDPEELKVEAPFGEAALAALRAAGHDPVVVGERAEHLGHAHAIELRADGTLDAASDPRSDGAAIVLDCRFGVARRRPYARHTPDPRQSGSP